MTAATTGVWAVIVARIGHGAKSRLSSALDLAQRRQLALAMLGDVLAGGNQANNLLDGLVAVVDEPAARWVAERAGALIVDDPDAPDPRAPQRTWVHWVLYDIPAEAHALSGRRDEAGSARWDTPGAQRLETDRVRRSVSTSRTASILAQDLRARRHTA